MLARIDDEYMTTTYKPMGTTDEVTTCEICGKPELKGTVILGICDADGNVEEVMYAGSTCGARKLGGRTTAKRVRDDAAAADYRRSQAVANSADMVAYYGPCEASPALLAAKYEEANAGYFRNHPAADALAMARDSLNRHREIIATGGVSAL